MKKIFFVFFMLFLVCFSTFAKQDDFNPSSVNEAQNCIVLYQCPDNWQFFILKTDGLYWARLYNSKTKENVQGLFEITKGKKTDIKLRFVHEGMMDKALKLIQPKLEELYSFGDDGNREKLPQDVVVTKNGKTAKLAFYVPFTNVLNVKDKKGNVLYSCKKMGLMKPDEIRYFSQLEIWPEPKNREMKKISYDKSKTFKASKEYYGMELPNVWKVDNGQNVPNTVSYVLSGVTERDAIIYKTTENWNFYRTSSFYDVIAIDCILYDSIFIIPESVKVYKLNGLFCLEYIFGDINYWESNRRIIVYVPKDSENFETVYFTGYKDAIDKNWEMIDSIIKTVKFKK